MDGDDRSSIENVAGSLERLQLSNRGESSHRASVECDQFDNVKSVPKSVPKQVPLGAVVKDDGSVVIPASRRPDGSMRKEVRIRSNYVPPDERAKYVPRFRRVRGDCWNSKSQLLAGEYVKQRFAFEGCSIQGLSREYPGEGVISKEYLREEDYNKESI